jgi:MoaA/NifB/PqqE/SkfB family radical SAM enzyme
MKRGVQFDPVQVALDIGKGWVSELTGRDLSVPLSVNILITNECNSRCVHCDVWQMNDPGLLTLADYERIADDLVSMGVPYVTIAGGEPLLRKDAVDIVAAFANRGLETQLTTHGFQMTAERATRLAEAGLRTLTFSMDAHTREGYLAIRGVDKFATVERNLAAALALRERFPRLAVETNTVLCRPNAPYFRELFEDLAARGVDRLHLSPVVTSGTNNLLLADKLDLGLEPGRIDEMVDWLLEHRSRLRISSSVAYLEGMRRFTKDPSRNAVTCRVGFFTTDIDHTGAVKPCGWLAPLGNVRDARLSEIWFGPRYHDVRREMVRGECPKCHLSCKAEISVAASPRHIVRTGLDRLRR